MAVLLQLVEVAAQAHGQGITLVGLHPATCYVEQQGGRWVLTGVAPRVLPLLLAMPPMRGGLCLADSYAAAEAWRGASVGPAADVFSLCAVGAFLVSGRHPFPAADDAMAALGAVLRGDLPALAPDGLGATLRRGLARDPADRLTLPQLRAALGG